jgi:hypothetical protein
MTTSHIFDFDNSSPSSKVLAILAIHLDGNEVSDYGETIIQATHLGPTVFPIVFAAVKYGVMGCGKRRVEPN